MDQAPELSVVIATHNRATVIQDQLNALAGQDIAARMELIVVNNCSSDNSYAVVERWLEHHADVFYRALQLRADDRPSLSYARNTGLALAKGEVVAFVDDDDVVLPGWGRAYCDALAHSDKEQLAGGYFYINGATRVGGEQRFGIWFAQGSCCAARRDLLERVGGFNESLPAYGGEDVELAVRCFKQGIPTNFIEGALLQPRTKSEPKKVMLKKQIYSGIALTHLCALHEIEEGLSAKQHLKSIYRDLRRLPKAARQAILNMVLHGSQLITSLVYKLPHKRKELAALRAKL
ncbi:glycosyltransferase [Corynebacterium pseudopelargi]|uniref:Chondroitin synthase n=1 Tax=Corynebacterium pseudopelargi TaxID=2080757 RepID=A0A3G6IWA6_9CORY|nr:glycosyltransferase family A protein [Corynebacterium pseudopelargi]AZA08244.1 Chondroitin synthase [Corynebacterium pseudopelargi]